MNILLLNHYAGSPEMGMEFRPYYFAREWVKMGHSVKIVAGDFSHLRTKQPKVKKNFQKEIIDGIEYRWIKTGGYKGNGVQRALSMFRFVGKLFIHSSQIAKAWKPDVVIASSTYPLDTYPAQRIAKKAKAKLIHEVHDMWPSTLYEMGGMSKYHPFVVLMQIAENSAYRNSDKVVSLPPFAKNYMMKHGMKPDKFIHIPNGVVEEEWENTEPLPEQHRIFLEEKRNEGKFIVGYFGGHAQSNALDLLLDVAEKEFDDSTIFVLVGKGIEKEHLILRKKTEEIKNVFFLPPVPKKSIPELLKYYDCIYMGGYETPLYRFGISLNKMYDSMMSGKPIICAISCRDSLISQYNCGIMNDSGDIEGILSSIHRLKTMYKDERSMMGENGKEAIMKKFTYTKLAKIFSNLF